MPIQRLTADFRTDLIPSPVVYDVVAPETPGHAPLPLLIVLHGGDGHEGFHDLVARLLEEGWEREEIPPLIAAMPRSERSFWVDRKDGSVQWETLLARQFLLQCRSRLPVGPTPQDTFLLGISMGGMGALRLAFRNPASFGGVAVLEPAIEGALRWAEVSDAHKWWRPDDLMRELFGDPFDAEYWESCHPPAILVENARDIARSDMALYIEVGDRDFFALDRSAEFLHRLLDEHRVAHEYRRVLGADHVGASIPGRVRDALHFLARAIDPPPDPGAEAARKRLGLDPA